MIRPPAIVAANLSGYKLAASIVEGAGGECRRGHVRRGFGILQITRDRLGLELSDVISVKHIKVTIPVILR